MKYDVDAKVPKEIEDADIYGRQVKSPNTSDKTPAVKPTSKKTEDSAPKKGEQFEPK